MATCRKGVAVALVLACLALSAAWAAPKEEKPYGLLFGTVYGPTNRPVYGVKVKIRRAEDKKAKWETYSDHHGEFSQILPVGDYVVWPDIKVSKGQSPPETKVHVDNGVRVDIGLHLTE